MIVDDNKLIIGSANINDRSLNGKILLHFIFIWTSTNILMLVTGNRDSEIGIVVEDTEFIEVECYYSKKLIVKGKL